MRPFALCAALLLHSATLSAGVVINEIAWGGTAASSSHEWMELLNDSSQTVSLDGWRLATGDGNVNAVLSGSIPAGGYYLLERSSDTTVGGIAADKIYTGALSNSGADLTLMDASSAVVDSARYPAGWPAGSGSPDYRSMERVSPEGDGNLAANWKSNDGVTRNGTDAKGSPLNGTPKAQNSVWAASTSTAPAGGAPQPSTPTISVAAVREVVINEIAWAGTGASPFNEWMELLNNSTRTIVLDGWRLRSSDGDLDVSLGGSLEAGAYYLLERTSDAPVGDIPADKIYSGTLSNSGADLTLLDASSSVVDSARFAGSGWPAGSAAPSYSSMERETPSADGDLAANWKSNDGATRNGTDAKGAPLNGTPKARNSVFSPVLPPPPPQASVGAAPQASTPTVSTAAVREVVVNEIAWAGTAASPFNEWMELLNNSTRTIVLDGWRLRSSDGDLEVSLGGSLESGDYYLLERTSDSPVGDVPADKIYSGTLSNSGADLTLLDASSSVVDSARFAGSGWPAGSAAPSYSSMERETPSADGDLAANWKSNDGATRNGTDAKGDPLNGTPKARNSVFSPVLPLPPAPEASDPSTTDGRPLSIDRATNPFSPRDPSPDRRAARFVVNAGAAAAVRTVRVCDVRGQVVRTFSDADISSGAVGDVLWDGKDDVGRLMPPGIYLVHLDAASPSGGRKIGRATVVLGYPK